MMHTMNTLDKQHTFYIPCDAMTSFICMLQTLALAGIDLFNLLQIQDQFIGQSIQYPLESYQIVCLKNKYFQLQFSHWCST